MSKNKEKDSVVAKRLGMKIMTIIFLETGQIEVQGPLSEIHLCKEMLSSASKIVDQADMIQRQAREEAAPEFESPAQKAARLRVEGARA